MYQGRETVLKYEILQTKSRDRCSGPSDGCRGITSPFDLQCHTGAKEVKVKHKQKRLLNALRVNISYLSTVSRSWYISWCKYIPKIDF